MWSPGEEPKEERRRHSVSKHSCGGTKYYKTAIWMGTYGRFFSNSLLPAAGHPQAGWAFASNQQHTTACPTHVCTWEAHVWRLFVTGMHALHRAVHASGPALH
jgi:hypothetical protein